jgi:glucosylceramidase
MYRMLSRALIIMFSFPLAAQTVHMYETTTDLQHALEARPDVKFVRPQASGGITVRVDDTSRFQTMDGFGASMTDGAAWLLEARLSPAARDQVMTQLFDPTKGIGLSFLREPIGSTDLSRSHFSFDDMPKGQQDPEMKHFSVAHDEAEIFPLLRQALKMNPAITVMLTPWSPPAWMKTKDSMDGGQLRDDAMPSYANYLTRSVQAFEHAGIPVKFLTMQNEPLNETHDYPGTLMLASQAASLIGNDLGPDLRRAGLHTMVLAYDHNWDHPEYPLAVIGDPKAAPFVAGSAMHCYGGDVSAQNEIHDAQPQKGIWLTECSGGTWDKEPALTKTGRLLIESTRDWAKAVVLWGIALDSKHGPHDGGCGTCRPLVEIDLTDAVPAVSYTGDYYGLAHASKFVKPNATHIASDSFGVHGLETVAFQNVDGSMALVVLNNATGSTKFMVQWHGSAFGSTLPAGAMATYTWTANH